MSQTWKQYLKNKEENKSKPKFNAKKCSDAEVQRLYWVLQPDHEWYDSVKEEYGARVRNGDLVPAEQALEEFGIELEND